MGARACPSFGLLSDPATGLGHGDAGPRMGNAYGRAWAMRIRSIRIRTASDILVAAQKTGQSRPPLHEPRAARDPRDPKCLTRMRECIQAARARFL